MALPRKVRIAAPAAVILIAIAMALPAKDSWTLPPEYGDLKAAAEKHYAEGSYGLARDLYARASSLDLPKEEKRWVTFRLADTLWRSRAASLPADRTVEDKARLDLEALARESARPEERDLVYALAAESLGDFYWIRRHERDFGRAWPRYRQALDWWAGSPDIAVARDRYLAIVFRAAGPPEGDASQYGGLAWNPLPAEILGDGLKIARDDGERCLLHLLRAVTFRASGGSDRAGLIEEEFEAAIAFGKAADRYDDALFAYAEWTASNNRMIPAEGGGWRSEPDYVKARALYGRIVKEFEKGETPFHDAARARIREIEAPNLFAGVANVFLPGSLVDIHLGWRNVSSIGLSLFRADLVRDPGLSMRTDDRWMDHVDLSRLARVRTRTFDTKDLGDHRPGQDRIRLDEPLPPGAYILLAEGGGLSRRELILVTDAALVVKVSPGRVLAFFCDAFDGSPIPGATVRLAGIRGKESGRKAWRDETGTTGPDGIAVIAATGHEGTLFAAAAAGDRQALYQGHVYVPRRDASVAWRAYAFTDRPAYRPGDEVRWKVVVRESGPSGYATPAGSKLRYAITDPRGAKVKEGTLTLNRFGSAWDELAPAADSPLGEYRVSFTGPKGDIGQAALFRLEEYKLPEFRVTVTPPMENGRPKTFRPGDRVEIGIAAEYYSGGPVVNAEVQVVVSRRPFRRVPRKTGEFPWLPDPEGQAAGYYGRGGGSVVRQEKLRTDSRGTAALVLETAPESGDFEYAVEARAVDASRREVSGTGSVRFTRQRYFADLSPAHNVYRPQDKVSVKVWTEDGNGRSVSAKGLVRIVRNRYEEIWLDPRGKEILGKELEALRGRGMIFPPRVPEGPPWRPKFRGYVEEEIVARAVATDNAGEGEIAFSPERDGYYVLRWTSETKDPVPVRAETAVYVATFASTDIGYRHGGLEILVDRDTVRAGEPLAAMVVAPAAGRNVLVTLEGDDLESHRLVRLDGTVRLLSFPMEERHVPNVFLGALAVSDLQAYRAEKKVVVPPTGNLLDVRVTAGRKKYRPGERGTLAVTTRDLAGRPVSAEVALSVADAAVFAIQEDYAGDPRAFFFGQARWNRVSTVSSFDGKRYARFVRVEGDRIVDEVEIARSGEKAAVQMAPAYSEPSPAFYAANADRDYSRAKGGFLAGVAVAKEESVMARVAAPPAAIAGGTVEVRTDFRATALWLPDVVTGADGEATVDVDFPDSLTEWRATARAATAGAQVGIAGAATRTDLPLTVRLQSPRFFVAGDTGTVSAVINNNTEGAIEVTPTLSVDGVKALESRGSGLLVVPAGGTARADWTVAAEAPGTARLAVSAEGGGHADAMEREIPVHEHGIEKFVARSVKVRGDGTVLSLDLPKERRPGSTSLVVQVAPSLAATMLDALPYLADYPYGCTEQTMSRFLPAVVTAKTLKDLGLSPQAVSDRLFGGIEEKHAGKTHPGGKKDLGKLDDMVGRGLSRLYDFQHGDGGWGWWKEGESDHYMTAYVVWGLYLAREAGVKVRGDVLSRGASFLEKEIVEEEANPDMQAWMLHALAASHVPDPGKGTRSGRTDRAAAKETLAALENLWKNRDRLNACSRALLAMAARRLADPDKAQVLIRNLENGVTRDPDTESSLLTGGKAAGEGNGPGTAHWGEEGYSLRWSEGGVEATATALRALVTVDPKNPLVEPVTTWLIRNRRGAQWSNTRDTAMVVLALNDYLRASGEANASVEYEVEVNGKSLARKAVAPGEALSAPGSFAVPDALVRDGRNEIRVRKTGGTGPLYVFARADFFSLEEPVTPAGHELFVRRDYARQAGRPTLLKGEAFDPVPLADGGTVTSGERVETVLTVEAKNDLEYVVLEDNKPAGLEAVEVKSGQPVFARELTKAAAGRRLAAGTGAKEAWDAVATPAPEDYTGRSRWVYMELRDRKAALFLDKLPEGFWEVRYEMRAEVPGRFHALPLLGHAMYVPEVRGNGAEARITVADRP